MKWAYATGMGVLLAILLAAIYLSMQGKLVQPATPAPASPADAYRYLTVIESADLYAGTLPAGADYTSPAGASAFWIPSTPSPDIHRWGESDKLVQLPGCTGTDARYLYSYRDILGDLTKWQQSIFNEPNALQEVAAWNSSTSGYDYRVYAGKKRWICGTVEDAYIEVMP